MIIMIINVITDFYCNYNDREGCWEKVERRKRKEMSNCFGLEVFLLLGDASILI